MRFIQPSGIDKDWSKITFGCWQIAPSEGWGDVCTADESERTLRSALDAGITAFDTAEGYGDGESERRLGKALGPKKDEVIIISKVWPDAELNIGDYQNRIDNTLRALNRDYVDVYLIHWPGDYFDTPEKSARLGELMGALKECGKTRWIGLSNFKAADLSRIGDGLDSFSVNEIPYSLLQRHYEGDALQICRSARIPYLAYAPSAKGLLAGRVSKEDRRFSARKNSDFYQEPNFSRALKVVDVVKSVADEIGRNPIEVALAWVLAQDNILSAIVGSRKPDQVRQFAQAADLELDTDTLKRLQAASDSFLQDSETT